MGIYFLTYKLELSEPLGICAPLKAEMTLINLQGLPGLQGSQSEQTDRLVQFESLAFFAFFFFKKQHTPYLVNKPPSTENKKNIFNGPLFCFIIYNPHMSFPSWVMLFDDYISKEHCCDHVICCGTVDNQSKGEKQRKQLSDFLKTDLVLMKMPNWQLWDWNNLFKRWIGIVKIILY